MADCDRERREQLLRLELRLADLARATSSVAHQLEEVRDPRCYAAHKRAALAAAMLAQAKRDVMGVVVG